MYLARYCNEGHEISHVHSQTYCLAACQVSARSLQKQRRNPLLFSLRKYRFSKQKSRRLSGKSHFIAEAWHWSQKKPRTPWKPEKIFEGDPGTFPRVIALGRAKLPMFKVLYLRPWWAHFDWQYSWGSPVCGCISTPESGFCVKVTFWWLNSPGSPHAEILNIHFFASIERRELQFALRLYLPEYCSHTKNDHYLWPDNVMMGN